MFENANNASLFVNKFEVILFDKFTFDSVSFIVKKPCEKCHVNSIDSDRWIATQNNMPDNDLK
jgi:uncharacterized protein YcbX